MIWEVEPGRRLLPAGSLPDVTLHGFDAPDRLAAFLDAVRWSAVTSADVRTLQAPFRSGVAIEEYQLEPVARAVEAPRVNLLLADDVGLGKTIEAGLVALELLLRHRAHRIMIVCPAGLTVKWHDEMAEKFGLEFTMVDSAQLATLRRTHGSAANPFHVYPRTIVSLPWLRGPKAQRLLDEVLPSEDPGTRRFFDLLILDEAHHVAPAAPKQAYAVDSQQTKLIRKLAPHFEHRLFLSATPHNGYPESFTALLEIIDNQRFARGVDPDRTAQKETVVRRLKRDITEPDGSPRFLERDARALPVDYPAGEREIHALLSQFSALRRKRMTAQRGRRAADLVTLLLKKRLFSSPRAFAHTVGVYLQTLQAKKHAAHDSDAVPEWLDGFFDDVATLDDEQLVEAEDDALGRSGRLQTEPTDKEIALLQQMEQWAIRQEALPDAKARELITYLEAVCRPDGVNWTNERVVVFTEYRDTQDWLADLLAQEGLAGGRLERLYGGMDPDTREQLRLSFQADPTEHPVRILLATDAASEGIDLHEHCHRLVNYDIPFNPNKLEQRIGRVDRYGQRHTPEIRHFMGVVRGDYADPYEADLEFLARIATKVARMEEDLGRVNAVLADAVQRRMLGEISDFDVDRAAAKHARRRTAGTVAADTNVGEQVVRLRRDLDKTVEDLRITPSNAHRVVATALELDGEQPLRPHLDERYLADGLYEVPPLTKSWVRATEGLMEKLTRKGESPRQRPITFNADVARGRHDIVLAHLGHPLVAMSTRLLRAAVWNASTGLHRVTAVVSDDPALEHTLIGAYSRFVLVGADGVRLHEEVLYAGGWLPERGRFRRLENLTTLGGILDRALTGGTPASPVIQRRLADAWPQAQSGLIAAIDWRTGDRQTSLANKLANREQDEQRRIVTNFERFAATLQGALARDETEEALFSVAEAERATRNWPSTGATGNRGRNGWRIWPPNATVNCGQGRRPLPRPAPALLPGRRGVRGAHPRGDPMSTNRAGRRRGRSGVTPGERKQMHLDWLSLVEVTGPFLSVPVLAGEWPDLEALDGPMRDRLRFEHGLWQSDPSAGTTAWIEFVMRELLGWSDTLHTDGLDKLGLDIAEHDTTLAPSFALIEPDAKIDADTCRLLGLVCDDVPTKRVKGSAWAATPVDRLAQLCRHHGVELGLATDGRWWSLVWAPRGGVTTTALFDSITWPEAAERDVVRAFISLLQRRRFFAVADDVRLPALLRESLNNQEEITDRLGVQVRQAVELLVAAIGRADARDRDHGDVGLSDITAHEVYHGAVTVMMRIVFLLFAEERGLLPADNELYAHAYSAGRLFEELEHRVQDAGGNEGELEHTFLAWHRLLALFTAIYRGIDHPQLQMAAHDGSIFDPDAFPWLEGRTASSAEPGRPIAVDDRTVLHMLRSVQHVTIGKELRRVSFRTLDVEQIGYVYEGLLSFEGFRAADTVVGLIGKEGQEDEAALTDLERLAASTADVPALAEKLHETYKDSRIGSPKALEKALAPLPDDRRALAETKLYAVTKDHTLVQRLLPFYGLIRTDLRGDPVVILPGALYVTESKLRKNTGTHYTPRFLAEQIVEGALEPLVYSPGPLQTADRSDWQLKSSTEILALKVADIAMGSGAFLVAACRYLAAKLIEAWSAEGDQCAQTYLDHELTTEAVDTEADPLVIEARRLIIEHCLYGVDINPMAVEMAKLSLWLVSMDPKRPFTFLDDRLIAGDSLLGITSLDQLEVMHLDAKKGRKIHERALLDFTAGVRELIADVAKERRQLADILGDDMAALAEKRRLLTDVREKTERATLFADLTVGAALAHVKRGDTGLRDGSIAAADNARRLTSNTIEAAEDAHDAAQKWLSTDQPADAFDRMPFHWPLVFPEVFEGGGFDAVIGNPPFLGGQKLTGTLGTAYREYLVELVGEGVRGSADLIAYFVLRAIVF